MTVLHSAPATALGALVDNLCALWEEYVGLAKSLLCMAHDFGDLDRDPSLMRALLFDE